MSKQRKRIILLNKAKVLNKLNNPLQSGRWLLAIDPDTLQAKIVIQNTDHFVQDIDGHEDLFPLSMAIEMEDGYIEGGD